MEFAVNYSPTLAELVRAGQVQVDRFKCPAWLSLLAEARLTLPLYIHFPLEISWGKGCPLNTETGAPADLDFIQDLLDSSATPYVNTHFFPPQAHGGNAANMQNLHPGEIIDAAQRDLEPLLRRFSPERILIENTFGPPETLSLLLEKTGCGFLFDLSHAHLSAQSLGMDTFAYARALPLHLTREIHVTGIQKIEGQWREKMSHDLSFNLAAWDGRDMDHLPMIPPDWQRFAWLLDELRAGRCATPWVLAFEYGGVGGFWETVTDRAVYLDQIPRMVNMINQQV